jgi:hypothetical protein
MFSNYKQVKFFSEEPPRWKGFQTTCKLGFTQKTLAIFGCRIGCRGKYLKNVVKLEVKVSSTFTKKCQVKGERGGEGLTKWKLLVIYL